MKNLLSLPLIVAIVSVIAVSLFFTDNLKLPDFVSNLITDKPFEASGVSDKVHESIDIEDIVELRELLAQEQYEKLNTVLMEYQAFFKIDQTDEFKVYDAFRAFNLTDSYYEGYLLKWIEATPEAYPPYVAIAHHYWSKGWKSRGYRFSKDTSKEQFEEMHRHFSKAVENLNTALSINPSLMVAYYLLIDIYNADGNDTIENKLIKVADELFPHSFLIKFISSNAKQPRWGGSYKEMEKIAKNAAKLSESNPKFPILYGLIHMDIGHVFNREKDYEKSLKSFNKAISFGDHWSFYYERSRIYYYQLKQYDQAMEDINFSIDIRPVVMESYLIRSKINFVQQNYEDALADIFIAERLRPENSEILAWKENASILLVNKGHSVFASDAHKALKYYNLAINFNENNAEGYFSRGLANFQLKDYETALSEFELAIDLNPIHFRSYKMIDTTLAKGRDWKAIISYWDTFISYAPEHAEACYERSGAHYHNQNIENAMDDLEKACDLGLAQACNRYNKMTNN